MAAVTPVAAPVAAAVVMTGNMVRGVDHFARYNNLFVKQTRRGCVQEMMGCEAKNEFLIATVEEKNNNIMYALEDASFLCRLCCKAQRESKMTVTLGSQAGGEKIMAYDRPFRCVPGACKCCCYQEMIYTNQDNQVIGRTIEGYWYCIPQFHIEDEKNQGVFSMQMPTCMGGMCVDCCAEGCCNCRIPFYVYPHGVSERGKELQSGAKPAQITKVWGGMATEMFSDADKFELLFPDNATPAHKAMLLGSVFFLNMNYFEAQKDNGGGG